MKLKIILVILLVLLPINVWAGSGNYKGCYYQTGDKVSLTVTGQVFKNAGDGMYSYGYTMYSRSQSEQNVWVFDIILPEKGIIKDADAPTNEWGIGWSGKQTEYAEKLELKPPYSIGWTTPEGKDIKPSETASGFIFRTSYGLPGVIDYYAEGNVPLPRCEEELEEDIIPGYHDLTPYGPGVVGKTIGPTAPPADFKPLDFLNSIINMKHEAYKLGWIKNEGILKSLDAKLENAKKDIEKGNTRSAKNTLKAFINEVEAQGCESYENCPAGKHLTSEAYGLLKYNAQYLIDHL